MLLSFPMIRFRSSRSDDFMSRLLCRSVCRVTMRWVEVFSSLSLIQKHRNAREINTYGLTESGKTSFVFHPVALELESRSQPPGELVKPTPGAPPGAPDWANPEWGVRLSFPTRAQRMLGWAGDPASRTPVRNKSIRTRPATARAQHWAMALRPACVPVYLLVSGSLDRTVGKPVCLCSGLWVSRWPSWIGTEWWTWAGG